MSTNNKIREAFEQKLPFLIEVMGVLAVIITVILALTISIGTCGHIQSKYLSGLEERIEALEKAQ